MIQPAVRQFVGKRAAQRCEYCRLPEHACELPMHVEHIVARQHGGNDDAANLAFACDRCNLYKGPNLSSIDPATGDIVSLFHPRNDVWIDHFAFNGPEIVGLSPTGRATVQLLRMNTERRLRLRKELLE